MSYRGNRVPPTRGWLLSASYTTPSSGNIHSGTCLRLSHTLARTSDDTVTHTHTHKTMHLERNVLDAIHTVEEHMIVCVCVKEWNSHGTDTHTWCRRQFRDMFLQNDTSRCHTNASRSSFLTNLKHKHRHTPFIVIVLSLLYTLLHFFTFPFKVISWSLCVVPVSLKTGSVQWIIQLVFEKSQISEI